ncbi:ligase-associated DNA damage response endonuclease PdeM [Novosphingobium sp.]|uniref:ligase-associated DNA damage response endonuclease PdeM n=1 Tax=Novosphingobium sp. TaxID=1874826 RepID=UPI0038BD1B34
MVPFSFASQELRLGASRALFWPAENALLVADLHLEKASWYARFGQMLPPYDSRETLERIALSLRETGARRVFCLGDNFHDADGANRLEPHAAGMLAALTRATEWVWITGNHDEKGGSVPGEYLPEVRIGGLLLRHEAQADELEPELSGHFHPKLRIVARGRSIARPCAVSSENKLILPAFGALTGGMDAADPVILGRLGAGLGQTRAIDALVPTERRITRFALWRAAA